MHNANVCIYEYVHTFITLHIYIYLMCITYIYDTYMEGSSAGAPPHTSHSAGPPPATRRASTPPLPLSRPSAGDPPHPFKAPLRAAPHFPTP